MKELCAVLSASYDCPLRFEYLLTTFDGEVTATESITPLDDAELPAQASRLMSEALDRSEARRIALVEEKADGSDIARLEVPPATLRLLSQILALIARQQTLDFAAVHSKEHLQVEVIHPDDFVMDLVNLNEKRAVTASRELRARKKNPPWQTGELVQRLRDAALVQTSICLNTEDVAALV